MDKNKVGEITGLEHHPRNNRKIDTIVPGRLKTYIYTELVCLTQPNLTLLSGVCYLLLGSIICKFKPTLKIF